MKDYIKIPSFILLNIFCILGFCIWIFHAGMILLHAIYSNLFDIQVLLFLFGVIVLFGLFLTILIKNYSLGLKTVLLLVLLILQIFYFKVTLHLPTIDKILENQVCVEMGICNKEQKD